jgi:cytochrome c biogenesis protein CcdA/thiol-disulfide isomerase/thioredoxin
VRSRVGYGPPSAVQDAAGEHMLTLIVVGLLAGVITSISPCVLPVLPVILAASPRMATGATTPDGGVAPTRSLRPYGIVGGLVLSFGLATLFGSLILSALDLPQDLLRNAGIAVLVVIGVSLVIPRFAELLERPFARIPRRAANPERNGFVLGLGLGLLYVPCAGPVLTTIAVVGATHHVGFGAVVLTAAFSVGAGIPLLILALAGDAITRRTGILRKRARAVRLTAGVAIILIAGAIALNLTDGLQRHVPGYTTALQNSITKNKSAASQLHKLTTADHSAPGNLAGGSASHTTAGDSNSTSLGGKCTEAGTALENCGKAPNFTGINGWLNTPAGQALSLKGLRGKVVLVDFWTYSCINCQRTLPHVEAWYRDYASSGLVVVGVHTPEFAFEHVKSNVQSQASSLGVKYPIAIDNDYGTWNAYGNQYWPAEYLIDADGNIRHVTFGEGDYSGTESLIRQLLTDDHPGAALAAPTDVKTTTPADDGMTSETYLGYHYAPLHATSGVTVASGHMQHYTFPSNLDPDGFALSGTWTDQAEDLVAGADAKLELSFQAHKVYLVLGGTGTVDVQINGTPTSHVTVSGVPKLYTLSDRSTDTRAVLTLDVSAGVQAYDFTFG